MLYVIILYAGRTYLNATATAVMLLLLGGDGDGRRRWLDVITIGDQLTGGADR